MDLQLLSLNHAFGTRQVLQEVNLTLQDVRALVLIGPSGGGKSTLLRLLGGLLLPSSGQIMVGGLSLPFGDDQALRLYRRRTGFVFQNHNLFPHLTALRNLTLPLEVVHHLPPHQARNQAFELLRRFQLESHAHQRPAELSGGQQQRVAIARAMAIRPQLLLLDEPTSALDPEMTAEVLDMIAELRAEGRDFVLVTHQMGFARRVADQVAFVAQGGIPVHGPPDQIFSPQAPALVRSFLERALRY